MTLKNNVREEYIYEVKAGRVTINEYIGSNPVVIIPEFIEDKPVTKIEKEAFEGKNLTEVIMPDTIKEVGKNAFASNMYMTDIKLSSNLKAIPEGMLAFCTKVKYIEIPDSVKSIGKNSFDYLKLREMKIPSSVNRISNKIFGRKLEECKSTTFFVQKGSFAEELLLSKDLMVEYSTKE